MTDLSLSHLEAELMKLDVHLHREMRRWQAAGQDSSDLLRGQYITDEDAQALLRRPFGFNWGQTVDLKPAEAQAYTRALQRLDEHSREIEAAARRQNQPLRLLELAAGFGLDSFDLQTLLVCLAPSLDLRYERLYGYLQDDVTRKRPSVNLTLDLLCSPGPARLLELVHFRDDAPLFRHFLLERLAEPGPNQPPLLGQALAVDRAVVAWLLGSFQPHADLGAYAQLLFPQDAPVDRLLVENLLPELAEVAGLQKTLPPESQPLVIFYGADDRAQLAAGRQLAASVGRPLLVVNLPNVVKAYETPPVRGLRLALRDARLAGAIPFIIVCEACPMMEANEGLGREMMSELFAYPDLAVVAGPTPLYAGGIERQRRLVGLEFPVPGYEGRLALWQHYLDGDRAGVDAVLPHLAGQFLLTSGKIQDAVASARDIVAQAGAEMQKEHLFSAARLHSSPRLASLARKINPRYGWNDIILPEDQLSILREMVMTVRGRPVVLETWGVGRKLASSAGVTALFGGPPGTGKTMAAEVIAAELRLDVYKIDLSTIISKYIGETEKNLERIFQEAENSNAILFFDEADALFGKRSEVRDSHDRYANIEISYLLQRMEAYDGVTILATNLRANLDEAFTRRLQFVVDFPFPEVEYRLRIWKTLFPASVPRAADIDFELLARRFKLAGGNIRNIIIHAAYQAANDGQRVTMEHLLHGTRRELQKMGRLIPEGALTLQKEDLRENF